MCLPFASHALPVPRTALLHDLAPAGGLVWFLIWAWNDCNRRGKPSQDWQSHFMKQVKPGFPESARRDSLQSSFQAGRLEGIPGPLTREDCLSSMPRPEKPEDPRIRYLHLGFPVSPGDSCYFPRNDNGLSVKGEGEEI